MAITRVETQIKWGGANTQSVATTSTKISDAVPINDATVAATVSIKATNAAGTRAADAQLSVYAQHSPGDTDQDSTVDYDTDLSSNWLAQLDTSSDTGETPAHTTAPISPVTENIKIQAKNEGATDAIVASARLVELRAT